MRRGTGGSRFETSLLQRVVARRRLRAETLKVARAAGLQTKQEPRHGAGAVEVSWRTGASFGKHGG